MFWTNFSFNPLKLFIFINQRCNVGGATTCSVSCHAIGRSGGVCQNYNCICDDENNRWGNVIGDIKDRLK